MKKAFALILATAMCLATLTACGRQWRSQFRRRRKHLCGRFR